MTLSRGVKAALWVMSLIAAALILASPIVFAVGLWNHDPWVAVSSAGLLVLGLLVAVAAYLTAVLAMDIL